MTILSQPPKLWTIRVDKPDFRLWIANPLRKLWGLHLIPVPLLSLFSMVTIPALLISKESWFWNQALTRLLPARALRYLLPLPKTVTVSSLQLKFCALTLVASLNLVPECHRKLVKALSRSQWQCFIRTSSCSLDTAGNSFRWTFGADTLSIILSWV